MAGKKKAMYGKLIVCKDEDDKSNVPIKATELMDHQSTRVLSIEVWQCPLEGLWALLRALNIVHVGLVVTLEAKRSDGTNVKFIIHKLPEVDENEKIVEGEGVVIVADASKLGRYWERTERKKGPVRATVKDYVKACGDKYSKFSDNCTHAVDRMWNLG